jgi:uncharacterized delta-60 repeat protein
MIRYKLIGINGTALLSGLLLFSSLFSQEMLWLKRFDRGNVELGYDITLDGSGNPIVVGASWSQTTNYDILLIKYTPNGDTIWTKYYGGTETEGACCVAIDHEGNIITGGWSGNDTIEAQFLVVKFSPEGDFLWKKELRMGDIDGYNDVAIDENDNIILAGTTYGYAGGGNSAGLLRKYYPDGNLIWSRLYDWSGWIQDIAISGNGDIFATGCDTTFKFLTVRFNSSGDTIWTRRLNLGGHDGQGNAIAFDSSGNVIIVGSKDEHPLYWWLIIKYTQTGETLWTRTFNFRTEDFTEDVKIDDFGNIYVCGNSGVVDTSDYLLVKFTSSGDTIWTKRYDYGYDDGAIGVVVDSDGNPIVTGYSSNSDTVWDYDIVTIKYRGTSGIEENSKVKTQRAKLLGIYPNPARSFLAIRLPLSADHQNIRIFDVSGKLIKEIATVPLRNDRIVETKISLKGINPGIYFLQLGKETKKFLVVK